MSALCFRQSVTGVMVLKKSKNTLLNTGCTLKHGSRSRKEKGENCFVSKTFHNAHIQPINFQALNAKIKQRGSELVLDGDLDYTFTNRRHSYGQEVIYSLNKRKRWLLSHMISQSIEQHQEEEKEEPSNQDTQFKLTLTERKLEPHIEVSWRSRYYCQYTGPDVVGYHDSSLPQPHIYPDKYGYRTDLIQKTADVKTNSKKKKADSLHNQKNRHDHQRSVKSRYRFTVFDTQCVYHSFRNSLSFVF